MDSQQSEHPPKRAAANDTVLSPCVKKARVVNSSDNEDDIISVDSENRRQTSDTSVPGWREVTSGATNNNLTFDPPRLPGTNKDLVDESFTPILCFRSILTDEILNDLLVMINDYVDLEIRLNSPRGILFASQWKTVTAPEFLKFLAVFVMMGLRRCQSLADYWSNHPCLYTPWFHRMFDKARFKDIYSAVAQCCNVLNDKGKVMIEQFIKKIALRFQALYYPRQGLTVDELCLGFNSRNYRKNVAVSGKYRVKACGVCDSSTGYVVNLMVYYQEPTSNCNSEARGIRSVQLFKTLLSPFVKGHHVFTDKRHATYNLAVSLLNWGFYFTGMINLSESLLPPQIKSIALQKHQISWLTNKEENMLCVAFYDNRLEECIAAVSTKADVSSSAVKKKYTVKPDCIKEYNKSMKCCERNAETVSEYGSLPCYSRKWWKKIFLWLMEVIQINAHILYSESRKDTKKRIPMTDFKKLLVIQLEEEAFHQKSQ